MKLPRLRCLLTGHDWTSLAMLGGVPSWLRPNSPEEILPMIRRFGRIYCRRCGKAHHSTPDEDR